jgi:hypothetical protein
MGHIPLSEKYVVLHWLWLFFCFAFPHVPCDLYWLFFVKLHGWSETGACLQINDGDTTSPGRPWFHFPNAVFPQTYPSGYDSADQLRHSSCGKGTSLFHPCESSRNASHLFVSSVGTKFSVCSEWTFLQCFLDRPLLVSVQGGDSLLKLSLIIEGSLLDSSWITEILHLKTEAKVKQAAIQSSIERSKALQP